MNWKVTLVLAVVLVALLAVYLAPKGEQPPPQDVRLFPYPDTSVTRVELARPGADPIEVVREDGTRWRMLKPIARPADPEVLSQMASGLSRFKKADGLKPEDPRAAPSVTGLSQPRLVVALHFGPVRGTLRFGRSPEIDKSVVFYQVEGDPLVYRVQSEIFALYDRTVEQVRARSIARYDGTRAYRVELVRRYLRAGKGGPKPEEERSVFENIETGAERGWFQTEPYRERLDPDRAAGFVLGLPALIVEKFEPAGDLAAKGLAEPGLAARVFLRGVDKPFEARFGEPVEGGRKIWAHLPDIGEVALLDYRKFTELPRERKHFRVVRIFPFTPEEVREIVVDAPATGRMVLRAREAPVRSQQPGFLEMKWEVVEPSDVKVGDPASVERWVGILVQGHLVQDFFGAQADLKPFGLSPPEVKLSVETKDGKKREYGFGVRGNEGFLLKPGLDEIFVVPSALVSHLKRLDLDFRKGVVLQLETGKLREIRFEDRRGLQPAYYRVVRDVPGGAWKFADEKYKARTVDPDRIADLEQRVGFIDTREWVSRDLADQVKYRLNAKEAPATLEVYWEGGPAAGTRIYLSERLPGGRYHGRVDGSPFLFLARRELVEALKEPPVKAE
jgi:hypothetical protein